MPRRERGWEEKQQLAMIPLRRLEMEKLGRGGRMGGKAMIGNKSIEEEVRNEEI